MLPRPVMPQRLSSFGSISDEASGENFPTLHFQLDFQYRKSWFASICLVSSVAFPAKSRDLSIAIDPTSAWD